MTPDEARGVFMRNEALIRKADAARGKALALLAQSDAQLRELKARRQELIVDLRNDLPQKEMARRAKLSEDFVRRLSRREMDRRRMGWSQTR